MLIAAYILALICFNEITYSSTSQSYIQCGQYRCFNNALCTDSGTVCQCHHGFRGDECKYDFDECEFGNPCYHRGICENTFGTWRCHCLQGWQNGVRTHCEIKTNPDINYRKCMPGWMGDMCENECLNDTMCGIRQTCKKKGRGLLCLCLEGWTGDKCGIDTDECTANPCQPFEVCLNTAGSYRCTCPTGWKGPSCKDDVDECLTDPCKHSGVCTNTDGTYTCNCTSGWKGKDCQKISIKADMISIKTYIGVVTLGSMLLILLIVCLVAIVKHKSKKRKKVIPRRNQEKKTVCRIKERVVIYE